MKADILTPEAKADALDYARSYGNPQLGYCHDCPNCGGVNTRYVLSGDCWLCIDCECEFTISPPELDPPELYYEYVERG